MASCLKRAVLTAGDRPARINKAAAAVQAAAATTASRVQQHAGAPENPWSGGPLKHGSLAGGNPILDAIRALGNAVDGFAKEVGQALSDNAREAREDAEAATAQQSARVALGVVYQPYTEPMTIPAPQDFSVAAVLCARVVPTGAPAEFRRPGGYCDFTQGAPNTLTIREIDGMTPDDPRTMTFTFVFFGV